MQPHFKSYLLAGIGAIIILASCSKTNTQGKFIPKDAPLVIHINGASLSEKLPWDEIKQSQFFKETYSDSTVPGFIKKVLDNPENSGIDVKGDLLLFGIQDSAGSYFCLQGNIKDATKFDAFNNEVITAGAKSEDGEIKYIIKDRIAAGWNKEKFIYIIDMPNIGRYDTYSNIDTKNKSRDVNATCKSIFALKEDNTLAKDEKFTALMKEKGDVHFWINMEVIYNEIPNVSKAYDMLNLNKLYTGTRSTATINFENGKITADTKNYVGEELSSIFKKYEGGNIDEDMIKRIPAKNIAALFVMNYKPEAIKKIIEISGFGELLNLGMSFLGFNVDDFIKANKGDVVIALTDIKQQVHTYPSYEDSTKTNTYTTTDPEFLFATSIADKNAFNLIINGVKKLSQKSDKDLSKSIFYNSNEKYFVIGNNKENTDKYLGSPSANFDFIKKLNNSSIAGYADIQYIMRKFESEAAKDSTSKAMYDLSVKMWENVFLTGGKYTNGGLTQQFEINLVDKNTNSLKQLNNYISTIASLAKEHEKKMMEKFNQTHHETGEDEEETFGIDEEITTDTSDNKK